MKTPSFDSRFTKSAFRLLVWIPIAIACTESTLPVEPAVPLPTVGKSPSSPQPANGYVAGFVIDESDECIIGARVELITGSEVDAVWIQIVCGFWDYGSNIGYAFGPLPPGVPVTVRASAPDYKTSEISGVPANPFQYATMIVLTKD